MAALPSLVLGACLSVGAASDQIVAGDLAPAFPEWAAIAPETPLGLAPAPGVKRILRVPELLRMARQWNLPGQPEHEVCVTRPVAVPNPAALLVAMGRELPGARIEILEFGRQPAPEGELRFPLSGLRQIPGGAFWSGFVTYGGGHRFSVWARVKVFAPAVRVVARETIPVGRTLDPGLLRIETREEFPAPGFLESFEESAGKAVRRSIPAGAPIRSEWLEAARVIHSGDTVEVELAAGAARLKLTGTALSDGAVGAIILVLNPDSKRTFRARVLSSGKVLVSTSSPRRENS
jgi:flagella basal body P-ring formation protein FlgA